MDLKQSYSELSDLLDGHHQEGAIDAILNDPEQAKAWYRYNTISAVLKNEHSAFSSYGFTQSISAMLEHEACHGEQLDKQSNDSEQSSNVVSLNAWQSWRRSFGGLAVAASVAAAMVLSVQLSDSPVNSIQNDTPGFAVQDVPTLQTHFELTPADKAEQAKLEEIQRYLDRASKQPFLVNEQYVGGNEVKVESYIIDYDELRKKYLKEKEKEQVENKDTPKP